MEDEGQGTTDVDVLVEVTIITGGRLDALVEELVDIGEESQSQ